MNLSYQLMEGASDGTQGGAGNGGSGGGSGGNNSNTGGSGNAGTGGAGGAGGNGTGGTGGAAPAWYEAAVADTEARAWVQNKGWTDVNSMVASHRSLEKMVGIDPKTIVRIAKPGDTEGRTAMYKQLGMPDAADKYDLGDLSKVQGLNQDYVTQAKAWFHAAGLNNEQAKAIVDANNKWAAAQTEAQNKEYTTRIAAGEQTLKAEWRDGYDKKIAQAGNTAKMLGFTADMIDGLESKMGYADTLKFLANLGDKLGEDNFVSPNGDGSRKFVGALTPEEARVQWDELKMDANYLAALMDNQNPGHKSALAKQTNLFRLMHPEG